MALVEIAMVGGPHDGSVFAFERTEIDDAVLLWYYRNERSTIEHGYKFRLGDLKAVYVKARRRFIESEEED